MVNFKEPCQLHNHSSYSLLDAVPSPKDWVKWCLENNTPGISITDHGVAISLYDAVRFPQYIAEINKENNTNYALDAVTGVPGVELYVKLNAEDKSHHHITVWAVSTEGYFNLMKLASLAYNDTVSYFGNVKARVTFDQIVQHKTGLKFGTGCIASCIGNAIMKDHSFALAEERYLMYKRLFGDDLYVEFHPTDVTHNFNKKTGGFDHIEPNECSCDGNMQKAYNVFLMEMVEKHGGKPIPVTDAHFLYPEDKIIQDALLKCGNTNGWYFMESYHAKRADLMYEKLKLHLGDWLTEERFAQWIENTYEVMNGAKTIEVSFDYHLPKIEMPANILAQTDDYDEQTRLLLMEKVIQHNRWNPSKEYVDRFDRELEVIMKNEVLNFLPYFLVYEDICAYGRSQGILQNIGRGSAGGSLISYYLKIIHIDPIKTNLPFERFLSHARIRAKSFPDIDCDFGDRKPIIAYLKKKYGMGFAQIATFQKMKTKNAIKDSMWALYGRNREDPEVKAICNLIPDSLQGIDEHDFLYGYTDQEDTYHPGQVEVNKHLANFFKQYPDVERMVRRLIGVVRGWGRHASAFVLSTLDLSHVRVPTMVMDDKLSGEKIIVTQYEASMVEKSGLVKADILGVTTIKSISDCMALIKANTGFDYTLEDNAGVAEVYRLPEDQAVYADFYNKKTDSSFQFNTPLIKGYIQQFCPTEREHLSALTALCRPGTLDAPFVNDEITEKDKVSAAQYYMDVRSGKRELSYLHPDLASCTSNAVFVYQEEVMKFLVDICDYTWEKADQIRSAIAKKKHEVMMAAFADIRIACKKRGWKDATIETACQQIMAFSNYSFNRSHSRCYSELGYITMYLKHHYPLEWWTAVLNNSDDENKMRHYVTLLRDMIKPPSLTNASMKFCIQGQHIVAPLSVIKGIGDASIGEILSKAPFKSLEDYIERVKHTKVNTGHFSALIRARAVDCFLDTTLDYSVARQKLVDDYVRIRKCKPLSEELTRSDPLSLFIMEKESNKCFNKALLSVPEIVDKIKTHWPTLQPTGDKAVPFMMDGTPVVASLAIAEGLIAKGYTKDVGLILLYEDSTFKQGISKRGKPYRMLNVNLSDGYSLTECTWWDKSTTLRWPRNSIVYIKGNLATGWRTPVSITVKELERIDESKET